MSSIGSSSIVGKIDKNENINNKDEHFLDDNKSSMSEDKSNTTDLDEKNFPTNITTILSPDGKEIEIKDRELDDAVLLAEEARNVIATPEEDRRLVRKIDLCMFPLMCLLYAIQYMDKVASSSAAIMGLTTDLKMHGDQYSWVGSSFYLGYLIMNLGPIQYIFQRTKYMSKMMAGFIIIWGMLLCCLSAPNINYSSFIGLRVLLGMAESVVTPCFTIITAQYWKSEEHFSRISIWFGMNGLGTIVLNAMAYGIFIHKDSYALSAWRLLFIITGVITIFLGMLIYYWIPDSPATARFLSKREKLLVVHRLKSNQQGFGNHQIKKYQIIEALRDPRTWLYFLFNIVNNIPNGGITNFISIVFKNDFGYSTKQTLLVNLPTGAIELVGCPLFAFACIYATRKNIPFWRYRLGWAIFSAVLCLIASCMLAFADHSKRARLAGAYLWFICPVPLICILSNISANSSGYTKKWTVSSINMVSYAVGNLIGPQCFIAKQAPGYKGAKTALVVCYCVMIVILTTLLIMNIRENKRRDKIQAERGTEKVVNLEFSDCTDFENPNFRYTL